LANRNPIEEIEAIQTEAQTPRCKVFKVLNELSEDLKPGLVDALDNMSLTGTAIAKWLSREGFNISERSVQRHRGGSCGCR
jgi:hypothetical protein